MRNKKKFVSPFLVLPLILAGCQGNVSPSENTSDTEKEDEKLEITGVSHIGIREYATLACSYQGKVVAPQWNSSNKKIATISSQGMVKGVSLGEVTITATYNGLSTAFTLDVTESWALSSVVSRIASSSYQIKVTGDGEAFDTMISPTYEYSVYKNGMVLHSENDVDFLPDQGIGLDSKGLAFHYTLSSDGKIKDAVYYRDQSLSLTDRFYNLSILSANYYRTDLREDNTYDMFSSSYGTYLQALYFILATQFVSSEQTDFMTSLQKSLVSLEMKVNGTDSFTTTLGFGTSADEITTTMTLDISSLKETDDAVLDQYLASNTPTFPEVYPEIKKIYELSKNHNYTRDFGNYTGDNISIHIGQTYFTEKYMFIEYTDEYLEETKLAYEENPLLSRGYVDIYGKKDYQDGSYYFTINDGKVVIGSREMNTSTGKFYPHWYDFYENLTLILDMLSDDFYMFDSISTGEALSKDTKEFGTYSSTASSLCDELFSDYLQLISGMSAAGLVLYVDYSEENPSSSICKLGGLFSYSSQTAYQYQKYPYTNFNKTSSTVMDNFLNSLEDR